MADDVTVYGLYISLLGFTIFRPLNCEHFKRIIPEQSISNEILHSNESRIYWLTTLEKYWGYELRISYPATIPTEFLIKLIDSPDYLSTHQGRKLLNIEKILFTNENHEQYARVTAIRIGLPLDPKRINDPVIYNIVLEKLYLGLPWEVWKTGTLILCTLAVVLTFVLPQVQRFFEKENLKFTKTM